MRINGESYEIIGIVPDVLEALDTRLRFVIPMAMSPQLDNPLNRYFYKPGSHVYGLLQQEETMDSALSSISAVESRFRAGLPPNIRKMLEDSKMDLAGLQSRQSDDIKERLYLLQGGVLFVLLIGCVNGAGFYRMSTHQSRHCRCHQLTSFVYLSVVRVRLLRR